MPTGKVSNFIEDHWLRLHKPDDGGADVFFHVTALREGDDIARGIRHLRSRRRP